MSSTILRLYKDMLLKVKQGNGVCGKSKAKPIFLLSIIECVASTSIQNNSIRLDNVDLVTAYDKLSMFYDEVVHTPMSVPYYHLHTSEFYHLKWIDDANGSSKSHTPSGKYLREHLSHAELDPELWALLQEKENREFFKQSIINHFLSK